MIGLVPTVVILLLLAGLLNARPEVSQPTRWAAIIVLVLALGLPPAPVAIPGEWVAALILPLLLWQEAVLAVEQKGKTKARFNLKDFAIWSGMALGIGAILYFVLNLNALISMAFSLLVTSLVRRAVGPADSPAVFSHIGPLALGFLLAEASVEARIPGPFLLALLGGAVTGALFGYSAIHAAAKLPHESWKKGLSILQVYLSYGIALYFGLSPVTAAVMSALVYSAYGTRLGMWSGRSPHLRPLDSRPVYLLGVLIMVFAAWQANIRLTAQLLLTTGAALLFCVLLLWAGRRTNTVSVSAGIPVTSVMQAGALLTAAFLLWPWEGYFDPLPLGTALLTAALVTAGAYLLLPLIIKFFEWMDDIGDTHIEIRHTGSIITSPLVRDAMESDCITITRSTPVPEIVRIFHEHRVECLPVLDEEYRLVGIVTEHDLFVKEKSFPRAGVTYMAVFNEPVTPEQLPHVYPQKGRQLIAADVMTTSVIWVRENAPIGQAVRLMVMHGFRCLPVLDAAALAGGKFSGIITRSGIIRLLTHKNASSVQPAPEKPVFRQRLNGG